MKIEVPASERKKALVVVDVQPALMAPAVSQLVPYMANFIAQSSYDLYVEVRWFADEESTFYKQSGDCISADDLGPTAEIVLQALQQKMQPLLHLEKRTRSAFKAIGPALLFDHIRREQIEEVHIFGVDVNDCVLATAYDATDSGLYTYVLEELSHHSEGVEDLREAALKILRRQNMTNHSLKSGIQTQTLGLFV